MDWNAHKNSGSLTALEVRLIRSIQATIWSLLKSSSGPTTAPVWSIWMPLNAGGNTPTTSTQVPPMLTSLRCTLLKL